MATQRGWTGLPETLSAIRRYWWLALAILVPIVAGAVAYTSSLPAEYDGKAIVALSPRPNVSVGADTLRVLAPSYVAYVTSPSTLRTVADETGVPARTLQGAVDASVGNDTATMTIRARMRQPAEAATIANAVALVAVKYSRSDRLLSATVVSPATEPTVPSRPRRKLLDGVAAIVAALIAGSACLVANRLRPRVSGAEEVSEITGHAVVGRIPDARSIRAGVARALADPSVGSAVRAVRSYVDFEGLGAPVRTIAVTSSVPGEGKSTIAALLAAAMARLDASVLLIDADLAHPSGTRMFPVGPRPGVAKLLRGEATFAECVAVVSDVPGLSVMPAVSEPGGSGDLIARRFFVLLRQASIRYDLIVVDCPPLLIGDAGRTLVRLADSALFVVGTGVGVRQLEEGNGILRTLQVPVLGAVINRAPRSEVEGGYRQARRYGLRSERSAEPS